MRLSPAAIACALLGLALILPACGEEPTSAARRPSAAQRGAATAGTQRPRLPADVRCRSRLQAFLVSIDSLRKRLAVGLNYEDYLREVHRLELAYDEVPAGKLELGCLTTAGAPAERAMNRYREAANTWGDCLAQAACSSAEVEPKLQRRWALASDLLSVAQRGLR